MPETLLQTKLYIPPLRPKLVPRSQLIERLNQGLQLGRRLTLISAPAGFGKTTLVTEWVNQKAGSGATSHPSTFILDPAKVAWLSLDENDNDPARFLDYLVAALQRIETDIGNDAFGILQSPQPPIERVLTSLINMMTTFPGTIIIVLDDYHLIESTVVQDALDFIINNLPAQIHLVIATREDPQLPLARLRARGQLTELRGVDLRFSPAEVADFLYQVMGLDLSEADIAALESRTEGWIAGLQLAALALQSANSIPGREDTTRFIKSFTGSHRFVLDYLIEEVVERQPQTIQQFLLNSAIVDQLTGSLCDALTGQVNGQGTLEMLEQANLFVVPLDDERQWYRYHHLFADLLRQRLSQIHPEKIPKLHGRASLWYEQNSRPAEAIRHALAAKDFERAADLAELAWPDMGQGIQAIKWLGWLKALPDEVVQARPAISLGYAWAYLNSGRLEEAEARLRDTERWLEAAAQMKEGPLPTLPPGIIVFDEAQLKSLPLSLASARAYLAQATGDLTLTVKYTRRMLELMPEEDDQYRPAASMLLGLALYARGDLEAAHRSMADGLAAIDPLEAVTGAFVLADIRMAQGQLHAALSTYEKALRLTMAHGEPKPLGTEDVYTGISKLHRERGDLETAAQVLLTARKLGKQIELPDWQHRWCIAQSRLKQSRGDLDGALDLLEKAEQQYVRTPVPLIRPIAALRAWVWLDQGRLAEALAWTREQGLSAEDDLSYLREFEYLTLARVLMALHNRAPEDGSLYEALGLLARLLQTAEEGGRTGSVIEILVWQALAQEMQRNIQAAVLSLGRALTLAEPEGYFQLFIDAGPPLARLLYEAGASGIALEYIQRLSAAYPVAETDKAGSPKKRFTESDWVEPLSERELEVLQLISEGLTNQEIAARLFLSLNTVKVHTRNIYGKLGVHHRMGAVARAKALRILPSA